MTGVLSSLCGFESASLEGIVIPCAASVLEEALDLSRSREAIPSKFMESSLTKTFTAADGTAASACSHESCSQSWSLYAAFHFFAFLKP